MEKIKAKMARPCLLTNGELFIWTAWLSTHELQVSILRIGHIIIFVHQKSLQRQSRFSNELFDCLLLRPLKAFSNLIRLLDNCQLASFENFETMVKSHSLHYIPQTNPSSVGLFFPAPRGFLQTSFRRLITDLSSRSFALTG
jgi:hypothetical protein